MAMKIQQHLLNNAKFYRECDKIEGGLTRSFLKDYSHSENENAARLVNEYYAKARSVHRLLRMGNTTKVESATNLLKTFKSMTIGRIIRYKFIDVEIFKQGVISEEELDREYTKHVHCTDLIVETIIDNKFVQDRILECSMNVTDYKPKKSDELIEVEKELKRISGLLRSDIHEYTKELSSGKINELSKEQERLELIELFNSDYPVENICHDVVNNSVEWFDEQRLRTRIWSLSKTSQDKLIDLMVKSYKKENAVEIKEFKNEKIKQYKRLYAKKYNKKELTADDKRRLVQEGKSDGLTQKEVAGKLSCSIRTVREYWNTAS